MTENRSANLEQLDEVDTEYHRRVDGMKRIEECLARVEQRFDQMSPESELGELKTRVDGIDEQLRALEEHLGR